MQKEQNTEYAEIVSLNDNEQFEVFDVEELERRLEMASTVDTLCLGNFCLANVCAGNSNGW